jgi:hypothetical protein
MTIESREARVFIAMMLWELPMFKYIHLFESFNDRTLIQCLQYYPSFSPLTLFMGSTRFSFLGEQFFLFMIEELVGEFYIFPYQY